jgi:Tfp pilus assembly protein PilW
MTHVRGTTVVELLLAAGMGLLVLSALAGALASGARALVRSGARAEASGTSALAVEAFLFDVRRAGHDATGGGIVAVTEARADRVTLQADLDADGVVDATSAEQATWACNAGTARLSRVLGAQSMPVADRVSRCGFTYLDAAGAPLTPPLGGLTAMQRTQVAIVALDLAVVPRGGGSAIERTLAVALWSQP